MSVFSTIVKSSMASIEGKTLVTPPVPEVQPKLVVVLSGGGGLGAAQAGMLLALHDAGLVPDAYVGSSAGALNAAWAAGYNSYAGVEELCRVWERVKTRDVLTNKKAAFLRVATGRSSLFSSKKILNALASDIAYTDFSEADTLVEVVTTKLSTGVAYSHRRGPVLPLLQASVAIPGVFEPIEIDGELHVDGGVTQLVPVLSALRMNPKRIIVLDISGALRSVESFHVGSTDAVAAGFALALKSQASTLRKLVADERVGVISLPRSTGARLRNVLDFDHPQQLIEDGFNTTAKTIPRVLRLEPRTKSPKNKTR